MSNPTGYAVNGVLSNISTAYMQKQEAYVAAKIFKPIAVGDIAGVYYKLSKADMMRSQAEKVGPLVDTPVGQFAITNGTYRSELKALANAIDLEVFGEAASQAGGQIDLYQTAVEFITNQLLLKQELEFAATALVTGVWGTTVVGTTGGTGFYKFGESAANPLNAIEAGLVKIYETTGIMAQDLTVSMSYKVFRAIAKHSTVIERVKYTKGISSASGMGDGQVGAAEIAGALGIKEKNLVVSSAIYNTANHGATASMAEVFGDNILISYAPDTPSKNTPAAGYHFNWTGYKGGGGSNGVYIATWNDPNKRGAIMVDGVLHNAPEIVSTDTGYFMYDCL
ncbi:MAG: hypothetical protein EBR82_10035 [Caulobacteraceae bacterium]|nr:hypothetical protein [Caulobacteraceae bacterium]